MMLATPAGFRCSALTQRLSHYLALTPDEQAALDRATGQEYRLPGGAALAEAGRPIGALFVVQQGWLHSSVRLPGGGRQILGFHYPGDLIGTSSIAWSRASTTMTAVSDCVVIEVPKAELGRLFATHGRVGGLLYAIAAAESVAMSDRLTAIGRMSAIQRLALLLLDTIDLPLTQADIGDALGLTKVHVNRTFREMEKRGMIARAGRRLRIADEAGMIAFTGFVDRHAVIATDWLPALLLRD